MVLMSGGFYMAGSSPILCCWASTGSHTRIEEHWPAWDHIFLGLFWMYNGLPLVWANVHDEGVWRFQAIRYRSTKLDTGRYESLLVYQIASRY